MIHCTNSEDYFFSISEAVQKIAYVVYIHSDSQNTPQARNQGVGVSDPPPSSNGWLRACRRSLFVKILVNADRF